MAKVNEYTLRVVTHDDCDLVFEWANDKEVRDNSFNTDPIKYDAHQLWFTNQVTSLDTHMFIFHEDANQIGLIRLNRLDSNSYQISYSISKENRGKGYATKLLTLIKEKYPDDLLIGKVKPSNVASIKAFMRAGYMMQEEADIIEFYSSGHSTSEERL